MQSKMKVSVADIARLCHQLNKEYCDVIGDHSQKNWEEAAEWQRESAIKGVLYRLDNADGTPEDQHIAWMESKEADGWKYGEVKDEVAKTHPCIVDYDELPIAQRVKDSLFASIVLSFMTDEVEIVR